MCACPKPGPGFPMSYVMVYSFLCVCPKPGAWISNVICHGLLIFVSVPSQALDFQCHMSWSTHFCICPKPGPGFPMSYVMVYSFLCVCPKPGPGFLMSCYGLLIFVCLSQARGLDLQCHMTLPFYLRWKVKVHFVDIGRIVDHHYYTFFS